MVACPVMLVSLPMRNRNAQPDLDIADDNERRLQGRLLIFAVVNK